MAAGCDFLVVICPERRNEFRIELAQTRGANAVGKKCLFRLEMEFFFVLPDPHIIPDFLAGTTPGVNVLAHAPFSHHNLPPLDLVEDPLMGSKCRGKFLLTFLQ